MHLAFLGCFWPSSGKAGRAECREVPFNPNNAHREKNEINIPYIRLTVLGVPSRHFDFQIHGLKVRRDHLVSPSFPKT